MKYGIQFDFDAEGEPPRVYIATEDGEGVVVVEVFEQPICKSDKWSWNSEDWVPGPLATLILAKLNESA